ncbi:gamma-glutamyltransferase [Pendulispora albinea]|uniref:Glutathione hydrolase proenzyme n=1 Tax=Pendulispora albinea TaxID=2741071 RepID=A0ABZ2M8H2_9BACT
MNIRWFALPLFALVGFAGCDDSSSVVQPPPEPSLEEFENPPAPAATAVGRGGAAATVDVRATLAAIYTLKHGGNAIDASVAAAAVLGVTDPFSCGIGGGGFMVVYLAKERRFITIDHREKAPGAQTHALFYRNDKPIPTNDLITSGLSVGVPGTVRGWEEALRRYGKLTFREVLRPAIVVAEKGFVVDATFADQTGRNLDRFRRISSTRKLFLTDAGDPRPVGERFKNPELGAVYRKIAEGGAKVMYEGELAQKIVETVRQPPEANPPLEPGVMAVEDLANYEARVRVPVESSYRGHTIIGMPAPSSGGLTLGETLNILAVVAPSGAGEQNGTEEHVHRYLEASRLAFADRNAFHGDPEYVDVPRQGLLAIPFATERSALITDRAPTAAAKPGNPYAYQDDPSPSGPPGKPSTFDASPTAMEKETTHITVTDDDGNIVSYTFTIEAEGGSGIVVPGHGFLLNNELTDFDIPSDPKAKAANLLEPGKRPRSSMTPTIVTKDGKPRLALGSPGGSTIITTVGQALVNFFDFNMPLPAALAAPRVSQRNATDLRDTAETVFLASDMATKLKARGHVFTEQAEIGAATGIQFNDDGTVTAAAEPVRRGGGSAMVVKP